jgi:hypothetical protein
MARTRTLSRSGSDAELTAGGSTLLDGAMTGGADFPPTPVGAMQAAVARLETLQMRMVSPQQPSPELDNEIARILGEHPDWRTRLSVATRSAVLRQKILGAKLPDAGRQVGSNRLGSSHHWRQGKLPDHFSDHTWPAAVPGGYRGQHFLPGGSTRDHERLLRATANQLRMNPLMSRSLEYSIPKDKRFQYTTESGEVDHKEAQRREPPGPGEYFKSAPLGPGFSVDGGETVIIGPNHVCPWKRALGRHINPVPADLTLDAAPAFSFSKTRRAVSDSSLGHAGMSGGPVKTDFGCLSPGHVYEHTHSFPTSPAVLAMELAPVQMYKGDIDDKVTGDDWRFATQSPPLKWNVSKVQVSVGEYTDQEQGLANARLRLALYDYRGRLTADCDLFGAPGSAPLARTLKADEAVVAKAKRGSVYTLEYMVGGGGIGRSLRVRDWSCTIVPEGAPAPKPKPKAAPKGSAAAKQKGKGVRCVPAPPEPDASKTSQEGGP